MTDTGYVLKTKKGLYYCGMNIFDKKLSCAKIYHNRLQAEDARKSIERVKDFPMFVVHVEIKEMNGVSK